MPPWLEAVLGASWAILTFFGARKIESTKGHQKMLRDPDWLVRNFAIEGSQTVGCLWVVFGLGGGVFAILNAIIRWLWPIIFR